MKPISKWAVLLSSGCLLGSAFVLAACGGDDSTDQSGGQDASTPTDGSVAHDAGKDAQGTDASKPDTGGETDAGQDTGSQGDDAGDAGTDATQPDSGPPDAAAIPNDPIAAWSFDEGTGTTAADSSGNGHTATLRGGATFGQGKHGTGLSPNAAGWAIVPATATARPFAADAGDDAGDAAVEDAGDLDAGTADGGVDASAPDASDDASIPDASDVDASDAGTADAGPPIVPLVWDTTKSFSVSAWVKVYSTGAGQWQSAFSRDAHNLSSFTLKLRGDDPAPASGEKFDFDFPGADDTGTGIYTVAQSTTSPTTSKPDGTADTWYHLVGVLDTSGAAPVVKLYVNGALESSATPAQGAGVFAATGDTIIGASLFGGRGASWNGVIDDVMLFARPLSDTEIGALYSATK